MTVSFTKEPENPRAPTINIIAKQALDVSLSEFGEILQKQLDMTLNGSSGPLKPTSISGVKGQEFTYQGNPPQLGPITFHQRFALRKNEAIVISFSCGTATFDQEFGQVRGLLNDFQFFWTKNTYTPKKEKNKTNKLFLFSTLLRFFFFFA